MERENEETKNTHIKKEIERAEDLLRGVLVHYHDKDRLAIIMELYKFLDRKWEDEHKEDVCI